MDLAELLWLIRFDVLVNWSDSSLHSPRLFTAMLRLFLLVSDFC
jgi:hypothetical protein